MLKLSFRSPTFWCVFAAQLFLILQLFFFSSSTFQFYPALPVVSIVEQAFVLIIWAIFILYRMLESPLNEPRYAKIPRKSDIQTLNMTFLRAIEKVVRLVAVKSLFFGAILRWTNYGIFDPRCYLLTVACLLHAFAFLVDSNLCKFMRFIISSNKKFHYLVFYFKGTLLFGTQFKRTKFSWKLQTKVLAFGVEHFSAGPIASLKKAIKDNLIRSNLFFDVLESI